VSEIGVDVKSFNREIASRTPASGSYANMPAVPRPARSSSPESRATSRRGDAAGMTATIWARHLSAEERRAALVHRPGRGFFLSDAKNIAHDHRHGRTEEKAMLARAPARRSDSLPQKILVETKRLTMGKVFTNLRRCRKTTSIRTHVLRPRGYLALFGVRAPRAAFDQSKLAQKAPCHHAPDSGPYMTP